MKALPRSVVEARLVEAILDAAVSADRWQGVAEALVARFRGAKVLITSEDVQKKTGFALAHCGFSDTTIEKYSTHPAPVNPWACPVAGPPVLVSQVVDRVLPPQAGSQTAFFVEFMSSEDDVQCASWMKLFESGSRYAAMYIFYGHSDAPRYNETVPALLQSLSRHIRRAITINQRISQRPCESLRAVVDATRTATFVVGADGAVWMSNAAAADLLGQGRLATRAPSGELVLHDAEAAARLHSCLSQWSQEQNATSQKVSIRKTNGSLDVWTYSPFCGARNARTPWLNGSAPLLIVTYERVAAGPAFNLERFSNFYRLTPAESRLAAHIAAGRALRDASVDYKIAIGTARNQLKSVFQKVGVHRQNELVALIAEKFSE